MKQTRWICHTQQLLHESDHCNNLLSKNQSQSLHIYVHLNLQSLWAESFKAKHKETHRETAGYNPSMSHRKDVIKNKIIHHKIPSGALTVQHKYFSNKGESQSEKVENLQDPKYDLKAWN